MSIRLSGEQLAEISNALMSLKSDYYGRGPEAAKAYLNDDVLICVLRGGLTQVEHTLIKRGRGDLVREVRLTFQDAMEAEFTGAVERVAGRRVVDYHSQILFHAEVVVELFVLESDET